MEITDNTFGSIKTYINALTQFGYKKQSDTDRLLIYLFIEELLTGRMRFFITEEDYKDIENALYCLYGSTCLIPYPQYINDDNLFGHLDWVESSDPRATEDNNLRYTEDTIIRYME